MTKARAVFTRFQRMYFHLAFLSSSSASTAKIMPMTKHGRLRGFHCCVAKAVAVARAHSPRKRSRQFSIVKSKALWARDLLCEAWYIFRLLSREDLVAGTFDFVNSHAAGPSCQREGNRLDYHKGNHSCDDGRAQIAREPCRCGKCDRRHR